MRDFKDFTSEEKELIVDTPITRGCFDDTDYNNVQVRLTPHGLDFRTSQYMWLTLVEWLEALRRTYKETGYEFYFTELVRLLPNSYKVVDLSPKPDLEKLTNGMIQKTY